MTAILGPGDWDGDGSADVLARDTAGGLWLYPGNGTGGWGSPAPHRQRLEHHDRDHRTRRLGRRQRKSTSWPATPPGGCGCIPATAWRLGRAAAGRQRLAGHEDHRMSALRLDRARSALAAWSRPRRRSWSAAPPPRQRMPRPRHPRSRPRRGGRALPDRMRRRGRQHDRAVHAASRRPGRRRTTCGSTTATHPAATDRPLELTPAEERHRRDGGRRPAGRGSRRSVPLDLATCVRVAPTSAQGSPRCPPLFCTRRWSSARTPRTPA